MTIPLERSLAVLWAGAFLIEVHGDRRVPLEHRRSAAHIARHFPTVGDVGQMSRLSLGGKDLGEMFEHPKACSGWLDNCPKGGLTDMTRLRVPTEDSDIRAQERAGHRELDENENLGPEDFAVLLEEAMAALRNAQALWDVRAERLFTLCLSLVDGLGDCIDVLDWGYWDTIHWLQQPHFSDGQTAAQLVLAGQGSTVLEHLRGLAKLQAS